jgi:hypothetical protein
MSALLGAILAVYGLWRIQLQPYNAPTTQSSPVAQSTALPQLSPIPQSTPAIRRTPAPQPTSGISAPLAIPQEPYRGIWISRDELAELPVSGPAWDQLKDAAEHAAGRPNLSDQEDTNKIYVLAKALVYARTGEPKYRAEVVDNLMEAIGTEQGGRTLALGRGLVTYVIAADLVNLPADPDQDKRFRAWLEEALDEDLDGTTLRKTNEERANNWGIHAGASRAAVALYLGDTAELERTAQIFKGWLGDRQSYADFRFEDDLSWQADPTNPVGINPKGAVKDGHSVDGALPEEMRRGSRFRWPPARTNYAWGVLQAALVQAELLHRAGYPTWEWSDRALLRAVQFLYAIGWMPEGDDEWQVWVVNHAYGTTFPASLPARPGKNMGWTDWTHSPARR